jgi:hypothetical protein
VGKADKKVVVVFVFVSRQKRKCPIRKAVSAKVRPIHCQINSSLSDQPAFTRAGSIYLDGELSDIDGALRILVPDPWSHCHCHGILLYYSYSPGGEEAKNTCPTTTYPRISKLSYNTSRYWPVNNTQVLLHISLSIIHLYLYSRTALRSG